MVFCALSATLVWTASVEARKPIRNDFFALYPVASDGQLDDLPSNSGHCGVCHFDFNGGGPRNPYGLAVEVGRNSGLTDPEAILAIENHDSDADGFSNIVEITDIANFANTPTFPGLISSNKTSTINIPLAEIEPYLTPSGGTDTIPPSVTVGSPNGGEVLGANTYYAISYTISDASGISHINIYLSGDGGTTFKSVATNVPEGTGFSWFVPNRPGSANLIRVEAVDNAGNAGFDESDAGFTITGVPAGFVPTTLRDVDMSGTQPHEGAILDDPDLTCATCHGNYDSDNEPWYVWRGCMMSQAARDPFFFACMAIAEQDAPSVGDVCIRCHSPGGWQEGRSVDTSGDLLNAKDRHGVHCDYCHRKVDYDYVEGVSPIEDIEVLGNIVPLPLQYANGQFITDPAPLRRGPYADAEASHSFVESPFHRSADLCGTCHDVSNPAFSKITLGDYAPNAFDEEHPDMNLRSMLPIERTYSEWSRSAYAVAGVYAPQFAGNKADGIVSTCQDCHMRDVNAKGANEPGSPRRSDLPLHDMMGGNTFVPDIIASFFPDEVDATQLLAAKLRAEHMLGLAATLDVTPEDFGVTVRVTNETGHKLPSGYPEGRRIWLNVKAFDSTGVLVFESGAYDFATADLSHDDQAKIYEIHPGLSPGLAAALGLPAGKSFHFVLNDTVYSDNRIPPRGFTNANFDDIQSQPVDYSYADMQYWDDTQYDLPATAESVLVTLYYQTTSKEYVEFLRDENTTNSAGQDLYDAWFAQGKSEPFVMAQASTLVDITADVSDDPDRIPLVYSLNQNYPNPFGPATTITYSLARKEHVTISVYDLSGRQVCTLVSEVQEPSRYRTSWDGRNARGQEAPAGVYFIRYHAGNHMFSKKAILLR
jgi:hypothetical protein